MDVKEKWQQLAVELGFEFKEGIDGLLDSPHLESIALEEMQGKARDIQHIRALLQSNFVRGMLSRIFLGIATGSHRDFEWFVYRSSSSSSGSGSTHYYVNVNLFFKKTYGWGMKITASGFFGKLGKILFPGAYVRLRRSSLAPMVSIKGKEKDRIKTLLSFDKLQHRLVELFSFSRNFKVDDYGIRYREPGHILSKERILELMEIMAKTAGTFY